MPQSETWHRLVQGEEQDKMEGMEMRKAAMETHSKRKFKEMDEDESTADDISLIIKGVERKKSSKRAGTSQMLEYLSHKHSDDLKLREKELELVGRRLHLEEQKMKLEEMKWQACSNHRGRMKYFVRQLRCLSLYNN